MDITFDLLKQILLNVPNYVFWKDDQLIYRGCNNNFAKTLGFANSYNVVGKTDFEMLWTKRSNKAF